MVKTKIIATLGPASTSVTVLRKMFEAGLDVVRLNFSHGTKREHIQRIQSVRQLNSKLCRAIKIMQDLEGYRLRIGEFADKNVELRKQAKFVLTNQKILGNAQQVYFDCSQNLKQIPLGALIYIDDGKIVLKVLESTRSRLVTKVLTGGQLSAHKGINILGVNLKFPALTVKDCKDLAIALDYKLDYLAQSFVRSKADIIALKKIVKAKHPNCKIVAKIENAQALANLDQIIAEADAILVARGDLGINFPIYKVPVIQKQIIKKCRAAAKPVIVATQMLESMTVSSLPTRAEVSDVANAIIDGASAVMLSGETAVGKFPAKAVTMMNQIIKNTENYLEKTANENSCYCGANLG